MTFKTMNYFKPFVEVDKRCEVHDCQMVFVQATGNAVCRFCTQEAIEAKEAKMVQEAYEKSMDFKRQYYLYEFSKVNRELREATFRNYKADTEAERLVLGKVKKMAKSYIKGADNNALFVGGCGSGKSHLAFALIKNYVSMTGKLATFINVPEFMNRIKSDIDNRNANMDKLVDIDLLVLDDVGSEKTTEWSNELLFELLDKRSRTIVTTNLSNKELQERYGKRIASRIGKGLKGFAVNFDGISDKRGGLFDDVRGH